MIIKGSKSGEVLGLVPAGLKVLAIAGVMASLAFISTGGLPIFKGGFYIIFLTLGYITALILHRNNSVNSISKVLSYTYPSLILIVLLVISIVFFIMPINLISTYQTRELALFSILFLSNYTVSKYVTQGSAGDEFFQKFPIEAAPLSQTWIVSVSIQLILIIIFTKLALGFLVKNKTLTPRLNLNKINIAFTIISIVYYLYYSYKSGGLADFDNAFYANLSPLMFYWFFGIGFSVGLAKLRNIKISVKYGIPFVIMGGVLYFFNYQLSYIILVLALYVVVAGIDLENKRLGTFSKIVNGALPLLYPLLLVYPVSVLYVSEFTDNSAISYALLIGGTFLAAVFINKTVTTNFYRMLQKYKKINTIFILIAGGVTSAVVLTVIYTNSLLITVQPNSWLATAAFGENCGNYKFSKNPIKNITEYGGDKDFMCSWKFEKATKNLVVVGDSNAISLLDGVTAAAQKVGWNVDSYAYPNCYPALPDAYDSQKELSARDLSMCKELMTEVLSRVEAGDYDAVLAGSGILTVSSLQDYNQLKEHLVSRDVPVIVTRVPAPRDPASGRNTIFFNPWGSTREYEWFPEDPTKGIRIDASYWAKEVLKNSIFMNTWGSTCSGDTCKSAIDGSELYSDVRHLSKEGSLRMTPYIEKALKEAAEQLAQK
jgi:hypothetical protein